MIKKVKIEKIEKFDFCGEVYNLEVSSNESSVSRDDLFWIAGNTGLITHNCFPKDLSAIIYFGLKNGITTSFLNAVQKKNNYLRSDRDWEMMLGRAVSDD